MSHRSLEFEMAPFLMKTPVVVAVQSHVKRHDADIVVLSEYRGGPSAPRLVAALHALGYERVC